MPAGNDIVAWQHPRCVGKWQNRRFLEKTCTPKEIQQLETAPNPDLLLWACWAAKEAAYKLSCFLGNRNGFIARRFETFFDGGEIPIQHNLNSLPGVVQGYSLHTASLTGWVHGGTDKYFAAINVAPGYIHALATTAEAELQQVAWGIQQNNGEENDNGAVRRFCGKQPESILG